MMNFKKALLSLPTLALIFSSALHAQILGPYPTGTATPQIQDDAHGAFYATGTYGTSGSLPTAVAGSSGGTWMWWYPKKAAFRAGGVSQQGVSGSY